MQTSKVFFYRLIGFHISYVVSATCHFPGVHGHLKAQPGGKAPRSIESAAVFKGFATRNGRRVASYELVAGSFEFSIGDTVRVK